MSLPTHVTLAPREAAAALDAFGARYGRPSMLLLMHAAVPETLRPELLALVRANFLPAHRHDPHLDADVLFGPVTAELGGGYFRIDPQVRWHALVMLRGLSYGEPRLRQRRVAELLWRWIEKIEPQAERRGDRALAEYLEVQRWVALAYLDSDAAATAFAQALKQATDGGAPVAAAARLKLGGLAAAVELPLAGQPALLAYARGIDALAQGDEASAREHLQGMEDDAPIVGGVALRPARELVEPIDQEATPVEVILAFESPQELAQTLLALAEQAHAAEGPDRERLRREIAALEAHYGKGWGREVAVAKALGRAWDACGATDEAIAWYEMAVGAPNGGAEVETAERLLELRARRAFVRSARVEPGSAPFNEARNELRKTALALQALATQRRSVGLHSRIGLAFKRVYLVERRARRDKAAADAIAQAVAAYAVAEHLANAGEKRDQFYPALNRMACQLVASALSGEAPNIDREAIERARGALLAQHEALPDFWSTFNQIELDLYVALSERRLAPQLEVFQERFSMLRRDLAPSAAWGAVVDTVGFVVGPYAERARGAELSAAGRLQAWLKSLADGPAVREPSRCLLIQPPQPAGGLRKFDDEHSVLIVQQAASELGLQLVQRIDDDLAFFPYADLLDAAIVIVNPLWDRAGPWLAAGIAMALRPTGFIWLSRDADFDADLSPAVRYEAGAMINDVARDLAVAMQTSDPPTLSSVYAELPELQAPERRPGLGRPPPDLAPSWVLLAPPDVHLPDAMLQDISVQEGVAFRRSDGVLDAENLRWLLDARLVVADVSKPHPPTLVAFGVRLGLRPGGTLLIAHRRMPIPERLAGHAVLGYEEPSDLVKVLADALRRPPRASWVYDAIPDLQPAMLRNMPPILPLQATESIGVRSADELSFEWTLGGTSERLSWPEATRPWQVLTDIVARGRLDHDRLLALRTLLVPDRLKDATTLRLALDESIAGWPWELLLGLSLSEGRVFNAWRSPLRIENLRSSRALVAAELLLIAGLDAQDPGALADDLRALGLHVTVSNGEDLSQVRKRLQAHAGGIVLALGKAAIGDFRHQGRRRYAWGMHLRDGSLLHAHHFVNGTGAPALVFFESSHIGGGPNGLQRWANPGSSIALELLADAGVRAVVAPGFAIEVQAARQFTQQFFRSLTEGLTAESACGDGRLAAIDADPEGLSWAAFQAWGDPDLRIKPAA